jgi:hypothetical protein
LPKIPTALECRQEIYHFNDFLFYDATACFALSNSICMSYLEKREDMPLDGAAILCKREIDLCWRVSKRILRPLESLEAPLALSLDRKGG